MKDTPPSESGIRELISRLHEDGVESGRQEARRLADEARQQAARIVNDAHRESETLLKRTRDAANREAAAAREAMALAARDALIALREALTSSFHAQLQMLIGRELCSKDLLRQLVLALAGRERSRCDVSGEIEVAIGLDRQADADELVAEITRDMLRDGVTMFVAPDAGTGIVARIENGNVEIAFSDEAIAELLRGRLSARFHDLLSGAIDED